MTFQTAAQWLVHADEARAKAEGMVDPGARRSMMNVAEGYEKLARHAAAWTQAGVVPPEDD